MDQDENVNKAMSHMIKLYNILLHYNICYKRSKYKTVKVSFFFFFETKLIKLKLKHEINSNSPETGIVPKSLLSWSKVLFIPIFWNSHLRAYMVITKG